MSATITGDGVTVRVAAHDSRPEIRASLADGDATVWEVGSTGVTAVEPLLALTEEARTGYVPRCSADTAATIATRLAEGFDAALAEAAVVVEHDPDPPRLPVPDLDGLSVGTRPVLSTCGWLRPTESEDYAAAVGFTDASTATIDDAGATLDGRGWGDWCQDRAVSAAWDTARDSDGTPAVVVNAHGSPADVLLLSSAPFTVLDGATAVARAVDADRIVVYLSTAEETAEARARTAAENFPDPPASVDVVTGPDVYRAAEPTMAIEAIEGNHRLEARLRPPGPDAVGIDGAPTVVHTARTFAHLAATLADDPPNTRLVSVTGDVEAGATVELPESATLSTALDAVTVDGEYKAACVGGRFGGLTESLDVDLDPTALAEAGLGTEGVLDVLAADRCVLEFVGRRAQFAADANCGRCVPCREGTTQLAALLRDVYDGHYDDEGIAELTRVMERSSICTFGVDAGRPARTAMDAFESELRAHADGRCPAGSCPQPLSQ